MNRLQQLHVAGQSIWLDFLRRGMVAQGELGLMMQKRAVTGVTSNPSIFSKAIGGSTDYDAVLRELVGKGMRDPVELFYELALEDIRLAADVFRPGYDANGGADGFVSFELEPRLAHDTQGSIDAAREIFGRIGRPNVMIKVVGTEEGVPAVEELIAGGINVNVTLLFSVRMYEKVARAYIAGLQRLKADGNALDRVASVASFFLSRVDTVVDGELPEDSTLRGTIAIANAQLAYERFREIFSGAEWESLAAAGARVQRPLWASTGTKNPAYSDVMYVGPLIGADTVNTMPEATMDAFLDHGVVQPNSVAESLDAARDAVEALPKLGIDLERIASDLTEKGIKLFEDDFAKLQATIERKVDEVLAERPKVSASLGTLDDAVERRLEHMTHEKVIERLWRKDHTVWKQDPAEISDRLGWLSVADLMRDRVTELETFAKEARVDGFTTAVLLGMGGSSLAPEVLRTTLGVADGALDLVVLDTTHPATVARVTQDLDLPHTLFVVASKSGTTIETLSHLAYFWDKVQDGTHFVAITDPGTSLAALGRERGFRGIFLNPPDIGGRYSALSLFGLVPAALIGADMMSLLEDAEEMATASHRCVPCAENPGAWLGAVIGEAARAGRDKLTLSLAPEIASFGAWIEQLIAESTGKEGTGIVPVTGEVLGGPEVYGDDRIFVSIAGSDEADPKLVALAQAGHPVVRLAGGAATLGNEFFRWEMATGVAGAVLGINPFDQPNVAEAKEATAKILSEPFTHEDSGDAGALLKDVRPGDYVAIQAYLDRTPETEGALEKARTAIRDRLKVATTVGFGPRFLHSTGQLHKGGPDTGVFVQVVDSGRATDLEIPGRPYTFGRLIDAQADGDMRSLRGRKRRVARITLESLGRVM
ncbi:MAG: bifunctional transaldolase/phosoglucose isomerase [Actinomycetota bacterium]|nr:bifunctional transaldolase/phosoglucose isomerase [Actinomycetota bacterium]